VIRPIYVPPFRVDLDVRTGSSRVLPAMVLARVVSDALRAGGAPEPAAVGLVLGDDVLLAELNLAHMGKSGPTDVLSFPLLPPEAFPPHPRGTVPDPGPAPARVSAAPAFLLPPGTRLHLGDIVISVERAAAQASDGRGGQTGDVRWEAADELRLLVVHGALHLCGWDHAEPVEEAAMRSAERRVLGLA
jgi:probable rRNA maturation factor